MKKQFFLGLAVMFVASTGVVSAHGFHEELLEGIEHMQMHLMQNSIAVLGTVIALVGGYALYRLMIAEEE